MLINLEGGAYLTHQLIVKATKRIFYIVRAGRAKYHPR